MTYYFDIAPLAKPRMVRSDRYRKRPVVERYWAYKDGLKLLANLQQFELPDSFSVRFFIPMPKSWSKKKKVEWEGKPHQQRPDLDNLLKALLDCLCDEDSHIYEIRASKWWATEGRIVITT